MDNSLLLSSQKIENQNQNWLGRIKPFVAVIFLQVGYAGMDVLSKAAMDKGMNNFVFVVYRHALAFLLIAPFAFILDKEVRPKMTISIFMKIVALSVLEPVIVQNLFFLGMKYTTATFATAMANITPAITFVMACVFRIEKLKRRSIRTCTKVFGTLTTVAGAMLMTLVDGPVLLGRHGGNNSNNQHGSGAKMQHAIKGSVMITICCFGWASFSILQAITIETYPAELSLTAWICLLGTIEDIILTLIMERGNRSIWSLNWDMNLLATVYGVRPSNQTKKNMLSRR